MSPPPEESQARGSSAHLDNRDRDLQHILTTFYHKQSSRIRISRDNFISGSAAAYSSHRLELVSKIIESFAELIKPNCSSRKMQTTRKIRRRMRRQIHIPIELIDNILEHFHTESWDQSWPISFDLRSDLSSCSFVCRAWRSTAQSHLFRDVVYTYSDRNHLLPPTFTIARWCIIESSSEFFPCKTLAMFYNFLKATPHLARCIRKISLVYRKPNAEHEEEFSAMDPRVRSTRVDVDHLQTDDDLPVDEKLVLTVLELMPRLAVAHLNNVFIHLPDPDLGFPNKRLSLSRLALVITEMDPATGLQDALRATFCAFERVDVTVVRCDVVSGRTQAYFKPSLFYVVESDYPDTTGFERTAASTSTETDTRLLVQNLVLLVDLEPLQPDKFLPELIRVDSIRGFRLVTPTPIDGSIIDFLPPHLEQLHLRFSTRDFVRRACRRFPFP